MVLAMFFLGCHAMAVQMLLMRELLAAFSGNELTIGAAFAAWFAFSGLGALGGRFAAKHAGSGAARLFFGALLLFLALLPPLLLAIVLRSRDWLGIPAYADLDFGRLLRLLLWLFGPLCLAQGAAFPVACRLAGEGRRTGVSRIYGFESLGGLVGGALFGAAAVYGVASPGAALAASAAGFGALAAALLTPWRRGVAGAAAVAAAVVPFLFGARIEKAALAWESARWAGPVAARVESPYQRLTVVRLGGQAVLYGNGQPLFMFPDPAVAEPLVHGVLARHPAPRKVLLVGGNPVDLGRALLAHPGVEVTYVEADRWIYRLTVDEEFLREGVGPPAFRVVAEDPVWYARRAEAGIFDVVLLLAPEPETVGLNRYYTVEFYRSLRRLLKPDGFLWTSVEATEQLRAETGLLAASVYRTLSEAFPRVQVAAGARLAFFASQREEGVPMEPEALAAAAARMGVTSAHFRPGQFLADESVDPARRASAKQALEGLPVRPNTLNRPVSHTFMLLRWNRFSGSRLDRLLWGLAGLDGLRLAEWISGLLLLAAMVTAGAFYLLRGRARVLLTRNVLRLAAGTAGFTAMALELVLLFLAQSLFGYVYERLAFLVALFMAGLGAGALLVRRVEQADARAAWSLAVAACTLPVLLGMALPVWLQAGVASPGAAAGVLHGAMALAGASVGILFPMVNRLLREKGEALTAAAGATHAADTFGAALGGLLAGLVLIPAMGIGLTCFVVALANAMLALCLGAARQTSV